MIKRLNSIFKDNKEIIDNIIYNNKPNYNVNKTVEECLELATVLTQQINKPFKNYKSDITEELGDALFRIIILSKIHAEEDVLKRIEEKLYKYKKMKSSYKERI